MSEACDPGTGMSRTVILLALEGVWVIRPNRERLSARHAHWLAAMVALAGAYTRAGGAREDLQSFEGDGFTWAEPEEDERR